MKKYISLIAVVALVALAYVPSAQAATLDGSTWSMEFKVIHNIGYTNTASYTREWFFGRISGRLYVWRETQRGYIRRRVKRSGPVYTTTWHPTSTCRSGRGTYPYDETVTFTLRDESHINGRLIGRTPASCGDGRMEAFVRMHGSLVNP